MSFRSTTLLFPRRVTPIPSRDPISTAVASSSSSSSPLLPLPRLFLRSLGVSFAIRFRFWLLAERTDRADLALPHGGDSFTPVARELPRKGERTSPKDERNGPARRRARDRPLGVALTQPRIARPCLPRFFVSRQFFFSLSFRVPSSFASVTNIHFASCLNDVESPRD